MKTLKESLLDEIDDTMKQGDSYVEFNKELKTLHTLKHTKWTKTSDGDYIYIWKCPNVLNSEEIKENLPCECDSILFVIYMIKNDGKPVNYTIYIDFTFMNGNKPYEKMFNLYSHYSHDRSKTLLLKTANNFISSMQQKDLIKLSKLRTYPTCNSCPI